MQVPPMKKGREPSALSRRLEVLTVGDYDIIGLPTDRIRSTIQGASTRMNTLYPERRFELFNLTGRTKVRRLPDIGGQDWAAVWAEAMGVDAEALAVGRPTWTYVPLASGFGEWAKGVGLGAWDKDWWGWEHGRGWKAQKAAQGVLRRHGVAARTWRAPAGRYLNP